MKKLLPAGVDDFQDLIEKNYYYVDKTLLVKELFQFGDKVILLPRPRRFGKTLNLSMLRYFFEDQRDTSRAASSPDKSNLFKNTLIWREQDLVKKHFQKYPVVFISFKDVKENSWEDCLDKLKTVIANEFRRHYKQLHAHLPDFDRKKYEAIIDESATQATYKSSLKFLTELLHTYYHTKPIVLIDEYDAAINAGYQYGYYKKIVDFMRSTLCSALKDNSHLERGILTGITRTAKEGIFSGLNNLIVCNLTSWEFQDKFGFTKEETKQLLENQNLSGQFAEVQTWYDGYTFGETTIYNPWSVVMFARKLKLEAHWVNTSDNFLIKDLIVKSDQTLKSDLELLISGKPLVKTINEGIVYPGIENDPDAIWNLFLFAGYVTYTKKELIQGKTSGTLTIPNQELQLIYTDLIQEINRNTLPVADLLTLYNALTSGMIDSFIEQLQTYIASSISVFDLRKNESENSYHLFMLGLLAHLANAYKIESNRESGYGRPDILLIPKKKNFPGIIFELKSVPNTSAQQASALENAAETALQQIEDKHYDHVLRQEHVAQIIKIGLACCGKKIAVRHTKTKLT